jgi:hypothetical protein
LSENSIQDDGARALIEALGSGRCSVLHIHHRLNSVSQPCVALRPASEGNRFVLTVGMPWPVGRHAG